MQAASKAEKLDANLPKRIVGQDESIEQIVGIYQTNLAGMSRVGWPIGNFLFLRKTGCGKTLLVAATAKSLLRNAKLIGLPLGYLGHCGTHPLLSRESLHRHHTGKASDSLWNPLLGFRDQATLTLGDNRRVDFSRPHGATGFWLLTSVSWLPYPAGISRAKPLPS